MTGNNDGGGGSGGSGGSGGTFTVALSKSLISAKPGAAASVDVTTTSVNGFAGVVVWSIEGGPSTITLTPASTTVATGASPVTALELVAGSGAAVGEYNLTVVGTSDGTRRTASLTFRVESATAPDFTIAFPTTVQVTIGQSANALLAVTPVNGFTGVVNLSVTGLPAGVTISPTQVVVGTSAVSQQISISVASTVAAGTTNGQLVATSGSLTHAANIALTTSVTAAKFTLSAGTTPVALVQSGSANVAVTATRASGFFSTINLTLSGLPTGVTAQATAIPLTGNSVVISLTAAGNATVGSSTVTVNGVSSANSADTGSTTFTLNVTASNVPWDTTFATDGTADVVVAGSSITMRFVRTQPDGRVLVGGYEKTTSTTTYRGILFRLTTAGALDPNFGNAGVVRVNAFRTFEDVAIQSDGKLALTGQYPVGSDRSVAVARLNVDGSLDTPFGTGGIVSVPVASGVWESGQALVVQTDGKIIVGATVDGMGDDVSLLRFSTTGVWDTTFGTAGHATLALSGGQQVTDLAIQSGKFVVAHSLATTTADFAATRFTAAGAIDTTFGTGGTASVDIGTTPDYALAVNVVAGDKLLLSGDFGSPGAYHCAVLRLDANGALDSTFAAAGGTPGKLKFSTTGTFGGLEVLSTGKFVVGDWGIGAAPFNVSRWTADGVLDMDVATWPLSGTNDYVGFTLNPSGQIVLGRSYKATSNGETRFEVGRLGP